MTNRWRVVDGQSNASELTSIEVYYYLIYKVGQGPTASLDNSKVYNIKKDQNHAQQHYRKEAIRQFSDDAADFINGTRDEFREPLTNWCLIPIPSGRGNTAVIEVCNLVGKAVGIDVINVVEPKKRDYRKGGALRSAKISNDEFVIRPNTSIQHKKCAIIVDDVIASGSTMQACCDLVTAAFPNLKSGFGLVWAMTKNLEVQT